MLEDYSTEYDIELEESSYITTEEFVYLYFPDDDREKP
jgi:hypothetical protein